jgi:hypothetical protein
VNRIETWNINQRRTFEPSNKGDMKLVKKFLQDNKWENNCPFYLEWPYLDIPSMLKDKITDYALRGLK